MGFEKMLAMAEEREKVGQHGVHAADLLVVRVIGDYLHFKLDCALLRRHPKLIGRIDRETPSFPLGLAADQRDGASSDLNSIIKTKNVECPSTINNRARGVCGPSQRR